MIKKKQLIKKFNPHIKNMGNFAFYNTVKKFMQTDLSDKSVSQIQDICRNIMDNDVEFKYRKFNSLKFTEEEKGWEASYRSNERTIIYSEDLVKKRNFKINFLYSYFHESQHAEQYSYRLYNNHTFLYHKPAYERLLIALQQYNLPYFSQLAEIDARFNQIDRLLDLINKNIIKINADVAYSIIFEINSILQGVNGFNNHSAHDIMKANFSLKLNNKNLEFSSEKLFNFYDKVIKEIKVENVVYSILHHNNPETLKEAQEVFDAKLQNLEKQAEYAVNKFMQYEKCSKGIINTSSHSKSDWVNNNSNFTTADKVQFICRYFYNNKDNAIAQHDLIMKEIYKKDMFSQKIKPKICSRKEQEKE